MKYTEGTDCIVLQLALSITTVSKSVSVFFCLPWWWGLSTAISPAPHLCLHVSVWHKYAQYVTLYVAHLMFVSELMVRDSHC